jgi:predicted site-specific integrase-resolvase
MELLNAKQAIGKLKISRATFYRWIKKGIIKPKLIGNLKRYRLKEINKLLK